MRVRPITDRLNEDAALYKASGKQAENSTCQDAPPDDEIAEDDLEVVAGV